MDKQKEIEKHITGILKLIGENPKREGLLKTPNRVARMYEELFSGYKDAANLDKIFSASFGTDNSEMVIVKDIDFYSHCEHHMVPFFGRVHIGYIPNKRVLGLSKFARLVEVFARRLQIQEQLNWQIADEIDKRLKPKGVIVVIEAQHLCMAMRGIKKINSTTITSGVRGIFLSDHAVKQEFFNLIKKD